MSVEWTTSTLGEVADITKLAGYEFTKHIEYNDGEIIALRSLNVKDGQLNLTKIKRISRNVSNALPRSKLFTNDILLTYTGSKLGDTALIDADDKYHLAPNVCRLRANKEKDSYYVYVYLRSKAFAKSLDTYKVGSGQPTVPMKNIRVIPIPWPPIDAREKIGLIYRSLNDKIELNRKMNQTLEEMAQALFKSWFVDFDPVHAKVNAASDADYDQTAKKLGISREILDLFPDEFEKSELGMIPKGWKNTTIGKNFDLLGGFSFKGASYDENGKFGLVTIKNVQNGRFVEECANHISKVPEKMKAYCELQSGDVLLSLTGNVGRVCIVSKGKYLLNQRVVKIVSKENIPSSFAYFYFRSSQVYSGMLSLAKGTAQLNLSPIETSKLTMIEPNANLLINTGTIFNNIQAKLLSNNNQTLILKKTRDTLLPKLLSGEIDVSELELDNVTH